MYKLIIGHVRVTVTDDNISRQQASAAAIRAIAVANAQGKRLSLLEISPGEPDLIVQATERNDALRSCKTLKQSLVEGLRSAAIEKWYPSSTYSNKDSWFDCDTGQEWQGNAVSEAKDDVLKAFEEWAASIK